MAALAATRHLLIPYIATRLLTAAIALLALALLPQATPCGESCHLSSNPLLDAASRWDAYSYLAIARDGYSAEQLSNMAFLPFYPLLMRILGTPFGGTDDAYLAAGVLISNGALAVAVVYLARLVAIDHDAPAGLRAALYLLVFPTSVFLSVVYPESLLLALSIGAVYHARRGEWLVAGALGVLAALTRAFIGAAVVVPLAIEGFQRSGARGAVASAIWAPVAFIAWLGVLWRITGDPMALFTAEANWGVHPASPLQAFADLFDPNVYGFPYFVLALTLFIGALVVLTWRFLRPSLAAYASVVFLMSVGTSSLTSSPRYYLTIFPAFVVLAIAGHPSLGRAYVALGSAIGALFTAMFVLWYWVA